MEKRILIVDKDGSFVKGLVYSLEQDGYLISTLDSGRNIIDKIEEEKYDLIILELELPDEDGLSICQNIRRITETPIIMISENDEDINKILALEYGADDYIVKPFNILELKARIKALFRRINMTNKDQGTSNLKLGDFNINSMGRKVHIKDREISLTGKEFDLFYVLITNKDKVFKRKELLHTVWGEDYYGDIRTVDVHIRRIREKIESDPNNPEYILTKWGAGYYFNSAKI